jgi:hypothetical protein
MECPLNLILVESISLYVRSKQRRIFLKAILSVVGRGSDQYFFTDRLDSQDFAIRVYEGDYRFGKRSSSA